DALKSHLFELGEPPAAALDDSVSLSSWPGEARECVEIARGVQAEAARGVRFDRMAVFLRSPAEYRPHLEEAFRRASIPVFFSRGTTRPDPAGRALLALLACKTERLSDRRIADYVSLAPVPDLTSLRGFALPMIERLDALPQQASWGDWLTHLRALATAALREPDGVLATLAEIEPMAPIGPIDLDEVQLVLGPRLRELTVP